MGVRLQPSPSTPAAPPPSAPAADAVGDGLRRMFDDVVAAPMPHSLVALCDALEDAFNRGELSAAKTHRRRA